MAAAHRRAKYWIARHLNLTINRLKDRDLCEIIHEKTGWPRPEKKKRKAYLARFWTEVIKGEAFPEIINSLPKAIKEVKVRKTRVRRTPRTPDLFYKSDAWRELRYLALKKHGGRCQCCGRSSKDGIVLHVDHIKPRSRYPELELELSNLQVLCEDCNLGKRAWDETDWRPEDSAEILPEGALEHLNSLN